MNRERVELDEFAMQFSPRWRSARGRGAAYAGAMTEVRAAALREYGRQAEPAFQAFVTLGLVGGAGRMVGSALAVSQPGTNRFPACQAPGEPGSRSWNTFVGHAMGVAAGFVATFLCGAQEAPSVFSAEAVAPSRAVATALAVALTILLQTLADAKHPPAAATTMLITLGGMKPTWDACVAVAIGVTLVTALGKSMRALPSAAESPRASSAENTKAPNF